MITGYGIHGQGENAIEFSELMQQKGHSHIYTFFLQINHIPLNSCSSHFSCWSADGFGSFMALLALLTPPGAYARKRGGTASAPLSTGVAGW